MTTTLHTPMMTVGTVGERMGVSNRTVFRWIKSGHLKAFRTGRVLRISEADLGDFIDNQSAILATERRQNRR